MKMLRRIILKTGKLNNLFVSLQQLSLKENLIATMSDAAVIGVKRPIIDPSFNNKRLCENLVEPETANEKIKKKKVVLLIGYCGHGYWGMQRNVGFKTIEEDLLSALLKANFINEESFNQIQNIQFQRAARTDKGVSAVRQLVSLKLPESCSAEDINKHLPECIRVFAIKRVTKGFNSKSTCDARTYSYMMPTAAFSTEDESESYRITPDVLAKINEALQVFTGTHNFHNFTAKKKAQDPSAFRYILKFECGEPFVTDNMEFITLEVKGQSFMLHQIRKMVGTVIAIVRGLTTTETISKAWGDARFDLPIAPGLGLVLEQVHYDRYNTRFGQDGLHECLSWDEYEEEIKNFKKSYIDPVIIETEKREKSMFTWVQTLAYHTFDVRNRHVHEGRASETGGTEKAVEGVEEVSVDAKQESVESVESTADPGESSAAQPSSNQ